MSEKTVLIYESDDKFVKALKLYFRGSAYEPVSASTDQQLFQVAETSSPRVLLVAVEVDDSPTRDLLKRISSSDATRDIPVIVMSTQRTEQDLFSDGVASVGARAFIKKPFIKKAILQLLDDVLSGAQAASRPGSKPGSAVDLGSVFSEIDQQFDTMFPGEEPAKQGQPTAEEEFAITLEDDAPPAEAVTAEDISITLEEDPAPAEAPQPVMARSAAFEKTGEHAREEPSSGYDAGEARRLRDRIRELESELHQKSEEFKSVAREKERIEHAVGKKESELIDRIKLLEKQSDDLEEDVKKRKQLVAQMTASVQQLNEDLEEKDRKLAKEIESWQSQLSGLQSQHETLQEKSSNQAHEIEDKADEIARLSRRVEDLEGERNELQTNLQLMTDAKQEADRVIEGLRSDLQRTEADLATERSRIATAKQRFETGLTALRESLDRELASAHEALGRSIREARESAEKSSVAAQQTLEEGVRSLLGSA